MTIYRITDRAKGFDIGLDLTLEDTKRVSSDCLITQYETTGESRAGHYTLVDDDTLVYDGQVYKRVKSWHN